MRATQVTSASSLQNGRRFTFAISPSFNWVARTPAGHDNEVGMELARHLRKILIDHVSNAILF
jgi:hypothetical protein